MLSKKLAIEKIKECGCSTTISNKDVYEILIGESSHAPKYDMTVQKDELISKILNCYTDGDSIFYVEVERWFDDKDFNSYAKWSCDGSNENVQTNNKKINSDNQRIIDQICESKWRYNNDPTYITLNQVNEIFGYKANFYTQDYVIKKSKVIEFLEKKGNQFCGSVSLDSFIRREGEKIIDKKKEEEEQTINYCSNCGHKLGGKTYCCSNNTWKVHQISMCKPAIGRIVSRSDNIVLSQSNDVDIVERWSHGEVESCWADSYRHVNFVNKLANMNLKDRITVINSTLVGCNGNEDYNKTVKARPIQNFGNIIEGLSQLGYKVVRNGSSGFYNFHIIDMVKE